MINTFNGIKLLKLNRNKINRNLIDNIENVYTNLNFKVSYTLNIYLNKNKIVQYQIESNDD